jgi:beta-lactamase class A
MTKVSDAKRRAVESITAQFAHAGCSAAWHVIDLDSGSEIGAQADAQVVLASVHKVLVALEFHAQADAGLLDPAQIVSLGRQDFTPGPTGISTFEDGVSISLRDLCRLMMAVSDNTAADTLLRTVGLDRANARARACGCMSTVVEGSLGELFEGIAVDLGFPDYAELTKARAGVFGPDAVRRAWDHTRMAACRALDPTRTTRSTPRDMTGLLRAIWRNEAASAAACGGVRSAMAQQLSTRMGRSLPDGATFAGKTGTLTGCVCNEIGVIRYEDGGAYAAAFFTRADAFFKGRAGIERAMAEGTATAILALRSDQD